MNAGDNVGYFFLKSRSWPRFGKLIERLILESVHHGHHIFDVFGDPKVGHDIKMDFIDLPLKMAFFIDLPVICHLISYI